MPRSRAPPPLATSLPHAFRYHPPSPHSPAASPLTRHRSFFNTHEDADDPAQSPAPSVHTVCASTRLEVLQGWEVNFTVLCLYAASALALVYVLVVLHRSAQSWNLHRLLPPLTAPEIVFRALLEAASAFLPLFFVLCLFASARVTDEQIWTCILLTVGLLATNPLTRSKLTPPNPPTSANLSQAASSLILNDAVYTAAIYLYLILAAHSYREFSVRRLHSVSFYLPKIALALLYVLVKVVTGFRFRVSLGLVPYSRLLSWLFLKQSGRSALRVTVPVLLTTILDTAFGFWLMREVALTAAFLARVPYVEHRAKQLGFRCFVYQTLAFCFNMIGLSLLITCMLPRTLLYDTFDNRRDAIFQIEPPVARLGLAFVYFTWTLVLAYVNLPASSVVPFVEKKVRQTLFLVRNSRVAVWLGLADIAATEDAEDSSDDEEDILTSDTGEANVGCLSQTKSDSTIPFRYRHHELFDDSPSADRRDVVSPLALSAKQPSLPGATDVLQNNEDFAAELELARRPADSFSVSFDTSADDASAQHGMAAPIPIRQPVALDKSGILTTQPISIAPSSRNLYSDGYSPAASSGLPYSARHNFFSPSEDSRASIPKVQNLRLRKNLFVMETQVMMVNAAYMSYVPGNKKEERRRSTPASPKTDYQPPLHVGSLAHDLNDLARQIEEENKQMSAVGKSPPPEDHEMQPDYDDGTMFRVDPFEMAERYGYQVYKYICDEELNTHAVVLIDATRVVVAFSGTRDVGNWGFNANIKRVVLDEKLSKFEFEEQSTPILEKDEPSNCCDESGGGPSGYRAWRASTQQCKDHSCSSAVPLRRSKSEESLRNWMTLAKGDDRDAKSGVPSYGATDDIDYIRRIASARSSNDRRWIRTPQVFATTQGVTEVASTFARELMTFGQAKVHDGFLTAYLSLRKKVMGALVELYRRPSTTAEDPENQSDGGIARSLPLFFCGHSMGGALATFASYEAARYFKRIGLRRRQDISVTTFGCPRLGNEAFKARYERLVETHWRFEIACDPIPRVPITVLNYVHVGVRVLLDQTGILLIDPSFIEVQWWSKLSNLYMGYRLHIRASYFRALQTYCKMYKNGTDDLSDKFWPFPVRVQTRGLFP